MPLFGGQRDVALFRLCNREIYTYHVNSECVVHKINLEFTKSNIYGESEEKVYYDGIYIPCLIDMEKSTVNSTDFGVDKAQKAQFIFLRDILVEKQLYIEIGDVIFWDGKYWETDNVTADSRWYNRDPNTALYEPNKDPGESNKVGWNVEVIIDAHVMRSSQISINGTRKY